MGVTRFSSVLKTNFKNFKLKVICEMDLSGKMEIIRLCRGTVLCALTHTRMCITKRQRDCYILTKREVAIKVKTLFELLRNTFYLIYLFCKKKKKED